MNKYISTNRVRAWPRVNICVRGHRGFVSKGWGILADKEFDNGFAYRPNMACDCPTCPTKWPFSVVAHASRGVVLRGCQGGGGGGGPSSPYYLSAASANYDCTANNCEAPATVTGHGIPYPSGRHPCARPDPTRPRSPALCLESIRKLRPQIDVYLFLPTHIFMQTHR